MSKIHYNYIFFTILLMMQNIMAMEQWPKAYNVQPTVSVVSQLLETGITIGFSEDDWRKIINYTKQLEKVLRDGLVNDETIKNNIWQGIIKFYQGYNIGLNKNPNDKDKIMSCFISSLDLFKQANAENVEKSTISQEDKFKRMYIKNW